MPNIYIVGAPKWFKLNACFILKSHSKIFCRKYIEIISKILPDFIHQIDTKQIDTIIECIYKFPNQYLYCLFKGIDECSYEEFNKSLAIGVTAPFYLSKLFAPYFTKDGCIINISSTRDNMSQQQSESYSAAKGAINSLTHSLMMSFYNKIRVNCIAPGWIDTSYKVYEGPDALQHPSGRFGNPMDIANMVLYLCSDKASFINGQTIYIDGGMSKQMIYHNDHNWKLDK